MTFRQKTENKRCASIRSGCHSRKAGSWKVFAGSTLCAGLIAGAAVAQEPTPNTFVDVPVPQLTGWNEVNYLNVEPGIDGYSGASARTQIYTSEAAKQAAETALANDPVDPDIEDTLWTASPAAVYYELDDGSGRAPGIQVVTDDLEFPTNNCIMSSGERVDEDLGTVVPKTCSDPQGSSKRYFLEIREADTPVDMVFDVDLKDIRYGGVKDPADDGGEALEAFKEEYGIGRIYRVIQKVINNSDERWVGVKVELGHGIGNSFVPFNPTQDGVAFELREAVPREFFEGETGAPDIEVWNPDRFATFSPKLFDDGSRERFDPGFFDAQAAGHFPPQIVGDGSDKTPLIFSGEDYNDIGSYGAITPNHFSMADTQAIGAYDVPGVFGYLLSDSLAPYVIARYDEGDPEGESDALEAWWDGSAWRYGRAGDQTGADPFGLVSVDRLQEWAAQLLGIPPEEGNTVRYGSILGDDFATQNMDTFIYISDGILDDNGEPKYDNITLRVTGVSTASAGLSETSLGNEVPLWFERVDGIPVTDEQGDYIPNYMPLATYLPDDDTPVALSDFTDRFGIDSNNPFSDDTALAIDVLANDLLNGDPLLEYETSEGVKITVAGIELSSTDPENGTLVEVRDDGEGILEYAYTPDEGFTGTDSFTYTVQVDLNGDGTIDSAESNTATVAIEVKPLPDPDVPVANSDSGVTFINTPVTIDVLANDSLPVGTPTVSILDAPLTGSATVQGNEVVYTPATDFTGLDRFTYTVEANGKVSNAAVITVRVDETPEIYVPPGTEPDEATPSKSSGGIFGCSYNPGSPFDPTLPLVALAAIAGLAYRNRRKPTIH